MKLALAIVTTLMLLSVPASADPGDEDDRDHGRRDYRVEINDDEYKEESVKIMERMKKAHGLTAEDELNPDPEWVKQADELIRQSEKLSRDGISDTEIFVKRVMLVCFSLMFFFLFLR